MSNPITRELQGSSLISNVLMQDWACSYCNGAIPWENLFDRTHRCPEEPEKRLPKRAEDLRR